MKKRFTEPERMTNEVDSYRSELDVIGQLVGNAVLSKNR